MKLAGFGILGFLLLAGNLSNHSIVASAIWASTTQNSASAKTSSEYQEPNWMRVDRAARNIKNGDEAAVRTLVNEVLADNGIDGGIIATVSPVPDRLTAAEIAYQKGKAAGVSEDNVANSVNQLARRFHAPPFAYTNIKEVRRLRLKMLTVYPGLIGRGSAAARDDSRPHFEHDMSPIEAFHVTATLIFQKMSNPEFQFSQEEIESAPKQDKATVLKLTQKVANGERSQELLDSIRHTTQSINSRDILDQSEQTLDLLGIPRYKENAQ
jgi:hypothetical protein